jgi:hypothetical protein
MNSSCLISPESFSRLLKAPHLASGSSLGDCADWRETQGLVHPRGRGQGHPDAMHWHPSVSEDRQEPSGISFSVRDCVTQAWDIEFVKSRNCFLLFVHYQAQKTLRFSSSPCALLLRSTSPSVELIPPINEAIVLIYLSQACPSLPVPGSHPGPEGHYGRPTKGKLAGTPCATHNGK